MSLARALVPRQPGLWLAAVALVAAVHAGGIVLALRQVPPEAHEDAGVFIVELAPVAVSLPITQLMLPPGPARMDSIETPAEAASAHPVERQVQPDLPPLPRFADTSSEFAVPERTEKPRVPEPAPQPRATSASQLSNASRAAAPPTIVEAPPAERSAAPAAGTADRDSRIRAKWENAVSAHLALHGRLPDSAGLHRQERSVLVRLQLDRKGQVVAAEVMQSSGSAALDAEAQAMVLRASPLPVPPEQVQGNLVEFAVPVTFKARR